MPKMKDVQPVNQQGTSVTKQIVVEPPKVPTNELKMHEPNFGNSHLLVWPTDHWGLTKELKRALIGAATKLNGHADKKALFEATLAVGLKHIEAKFAEKSAMNTAMIAATKDDE